MSIKLISFDLQGTLSSHAFASEVWLKLLPRALADCNENLLKELWQSAESEKRYYDMGYWLARAGCEKSVADLIHEAETAPRLFPEMVELVQYLCREVALIIISATTREFIDFELGAAKTHFARVYSTHDDFGIPGKSPQIFAKVQKEWGLDAKECFHTGDHIEMDGINPQRAGWHSLYIASKIDAPRRAGQSVDVIGRLLPCRGKRCLAMK